MRKDNGGETRTNLCLSDLETIAGWTEEPGKGSRVWDTNDVLKGKVKTGNISVSTGDTFTPSIISRPGVLPPSLPRSAVSYCRLFLLFTSTKSSVFSPLLHPLLLVILLSPRFHMLLIL